MSFLPELRLEPGRDRPLRLRHPWVYSGTLQRIPGDLQPGALVRLRSAEGEILGVGSCNPHCSIAVRMLTHGRAEFREEDLLARLRSAADLRRRTVAADTSAYRLVNGEGDLLPGLVVDRYGDALVLQVLTAGAEAWRDSVIAELQRLLEPRAIIERSAGSVRRTEGLEDREGVLRGELRERCTIRENGLSFAVDLRGGQKTGFFLDQRENRRQVGRLAHGRRVLDLFSHTGAFAVYAACGGASRVTSVESSPRNVEQAGENARINGVEGIDSVRARVQSFLGEVRDAYDLIVVDPPALARHRREVERATRAYRDIHRRVLRIAAPDALIATFSCSAHVGPDLFRRVITAGAAEARRSARVLAELGPGSDHPVLLSHPEGHYLTGLLLHVP